MIASVRYVADGKPTHALVALWKAAEGVPGLPWWMSVCDQNGMPTAPFIAISRRAFDITPGAGLSMSIPAFTRDGLPTDYMIGKWRQWTS